MGTLADNWTKDADGKPVDWLDPKYRPGPDQIRLVLDGENQKRIPEADRSKRIREYYALVRRRMRGARPEDQAQAKLEI